MKASELRIGNFYNQFGNITEVDWSVLKDLKDAPIDQLWCKPIPLTEEWLLKFGFDKIDFQFIKNGIKLFPIRDLYYRGNFPIKSDIKYVHQLQNLYFALTGEELTIKD